MPLRLDIQSFHSELTLLCNLRKVSYLPSAVYVRDMESMWEWTQLWKHESFVYAAEGGTKQTSLQMRSKTEKWDLSPMVISTSTCLLHPL